MKIIDKTNMKAEFNSRLPAHPSSQAIHAAEEMGLTKREYIAALAMQALISRGPASIYEVSAEAREYADELLRALES